MNHKTTFLLAVMAWAGVLGHASNSSGATSETEDPAAHPVARVVLCIGDSITQGHVSIKTYCDLSRHKTINVGQPGADTQTWTNLFIRRALKPLRKQKVDVVSILLGLNDVADYGKGPAKPAQVRANVETIISKVLSFQNVLNKVTGTDHVPEIVLSLEHVPPGTKWEPMKRYNDELRNLAETMEGVRLGVEWEKIKHEFPPDCWPSQTQLHPGMECHRVAAKYMDRAWDSPSSHSHPPQSDPR